MLSTEELYGIKPVELKGMRYEDAIEYKLKALKRKKQYLINQADSYLKMGNYTRVQEVNIDLRQVVKAEKFNEFLLNELKGE